MDRFLLFDLTGKKKIELSLIFFFLDIINKRAKSDTDLSSSSLIRLLNEIYLYQLDLFMPRIHLRFI